MLINVLRSNAEDFEDRVRVIFSMRQIPLALAGLLMLVISEDIKSFISGSALYEHFLQKVNVYGLSL